jgi:Cytochrome P450
MLSPSSLDAVSVLRQQETRSSMHHIHARSGSPVDIGTEMFVTVMNVVTNTMWGGTLEGDEERESVGKDFKELVADITDLLGRPNVSDFFPALARFDLQGIQSKMEVLKERFDKIFERMIGKKYSGQGEKTKDFLEVLLRLEREGGDSKTPFTMTHVKALLMVYNTEVL